MSTHTLYIRNLNEKIKVPKLKEVLTAKFSPFGKLLDVVAHKNIRMRGQAFVVFDDENAAKKAKLELENRQLFDKPMVIEFARKKSDAEVNKEGLDQFLKHKQARLVEKEQRQAKDGDKSSKKRKQNGTSVGGSAAKKNKQDVQKLSAAPPNKILFLENIPDDLDKDYFTGIFSAFPGFLEVRLFAVRHVGFVEYEEEQQAVAAKQSAEQPLGEKGVSVSYAKR